MNKEIKIRPSTIDDLDTIAEFCSLIAIHERGEFNAEEKKTKLSRHLFSDTPKLFCILASADNIVCGYATYSTEFSVFMADEYLRLNTLYILPEYRNMGVGKKLIEYLFEIARQNNLPSLQCFTPDFNTEAIDFYKRQGAKIKNSVRFYFDIK